VQFICCYFIEGHGFVGFSSDDDTCVGAFVSSQAHVQTMLNEARCPNGERRDSLLECMRLAQLPASSSQSMHRVHNWLVLAIAGMIRDVDLCFRNAVAVVGEGPRLDYVLLPRTHGQQSGLIGFTTCRGSSIAVVFHSRQQARQVVDRLPWLSADTRAKVLIGIQSCLLPDTANEPELTLSNPFVDYLNTGYTLSRQVSAKAN